jgi:hypothetical protein
MFYLGLSIEKYRFLNIKSIGKGKPVFVGLIRDIILRINNINTRIIFFLTNTNTDQIFLGQLFIRKTEFSFIYPGNRN